MVTGDTHFIDSTCIHETFAPCAAVTPEKRFTSPQLIESTVQTKLCPTVDPSPSTYSINAE